MVLVSLDPCSGFSISLFSGDGDVDVDRVSLSGGIPIFTSGPLLLLCLFPLLDLSYSIPIYLFDRVFSSAVHLRSLRLEGKKRKEKTFDLLLHSESLCESCIEAVVLLYVCSRGRVKRWNSVDSG